VREGFKELREQLQEEIDKLRNDMQKNFLQVKTDQLALKVKVQADLQAAKEDLGSAVDELRKSLRQDRQAANERLDELQNSLHQGQQAAKEDLASTRTELEQLQLAAAKEMVDAQTELLKAKEVLQKDLLAAKTELRTRRDEAMEVLERGIEGVEGVNPEDLWVRVVENANWIPREHNRRGGLPWVELAADGPENRWFAVGPVNGSAINAAAPLGRKPAHDDEVWYPRDVLQLTRATVQQADALLFYYGLADPTDPTKQFSPTTPLEEKVNALLKFLTHTPVRILHVRTRARIYVPTPTR
jgi:hypothetical protein